jgi:serralysin
VTLDAKSTNANPNDAFVFIGAAAVTNVAGQLRAVQSGSATFVEADVTGDGIADVMLRLTPLLVLTASDFAP